MAKKKVKKKPRHFVKGSKVVIIRSGFDSMPILQNAIIVQEPESQSGNPFRVKYKEEPDIEDEDLQPARWKTIDVSETKIFWTWQQALIHTQYWLLGRIRKVVDALGDVHSAIRDENE